MKLSDDYCNTLCELSSAIVPELVRRAMPITHGLPKRQTLLLSDVTAQSFLDQLRSDVEIFREIFDTEFPGQEHFVKRSVFQTVAVKQRVAVCTEEHWTCTQRLPSGLESILYLPHQSNVGWPFRTILLMGVSCAAGQF